MSNLKTILDYGTKNLRLAVFDESANKVYSSDKEIIDNREKTLSILIKDAEKYLSNHIENVIVLYDSPKYYSLEISIKKVFDHPVSIKTVYDSLIDEGNFIISQNNFKDQIIHLIVNNIIVDEYKKLDEIIENIKVKSLVLDIKFICLDKFLVNDVSNSFKKNNLIVSNIYCSSYVKTFFYRKKLPDKSFVIFLDIGFNRTSCFTFFDSKFTSLESISIGGSNITKDISKVLNLSISYSEDLKIKFYEKESNLNFNRKNKNNVNIFNEVSEKKISINLLKQIIEARVDEIIDVLTHQNHYFKYFNSSQKPILVFTGAGSKLLSNKYNLKIREFLSDVYVFGDDDFNVCEAGFHYNKSDESVLNQSRKKLEKYGFFEKFFNLFSK